ncbi:MAG: hypothetical protein KBD12_01400 [Candidatus Pacebacteria bacterium]|nr:hypothetical protein [Candidatus Paceibacterota bacterium]
MTNNFKYKKKSKRKLKTFFKVFLILFFISSISFSLYKLNIFPSTSEYIKKYYFNFKSFFIKKKEIKTNPGEKQENIFIDTFKAKLLNENLEYASSTIMDNGDVKIFLKNTENDSGFIFVNLKDNIGEIWNTFDSVILVDPLKSLITKNLFDLNYIDLRFKNKVFYKFKDLNNIKNNTISNISNEQSTTTIASDLSSSTSSNDNLNTN